MKTQFAAAMWIINYQERIRSGVAPPNTNRKVRLHKKGTKHPGTKPPHNPLRGALRKRTKRLQERQHGMQDRVNTPGYRKPGSMTK